MVVNYFYGDALVKVLAAARNGRVRKTDGVHGICTAKAGGMAEGEKSAAAPIGERGTYPLKRVFSLLIISHEVS